MNARMFAALQRLASLEPLLIQQLPKVRDIAEAVEMIQAAAMPHGIALDTGELTRLLHTVNERMKSKELSDDQLADVDGGRLASLLFQGSDAIEQSSITSKPIPL